MVWLSLVACVNSTTMGIENQPQPRHLPSIEVPPAPPNLGVTWHGDVRPLVEEHCSHCHDGGVAPFVFDDPDQLAVLGPLMVSAVMSRTMPPWSFHDDCRTVDGSLALDDATIAVFAAWGESGYPLGNESDYTASPPDELIQLPPPDLVAWPRTPLEPDTGLPDDYVCAVTDLTLDEETFVTAARVVPDRLDLLHHVILYAVPPEQVRELRQIAGGNLDRPFSCWESPVMHLGPKLDIWVPGKRPLTDPYGEHDAIRVPAGSLVVMETHFNTLTWDAEQPAVDNSGIELWTLPAEQVEGLLVSWTVYDTELDIPAGAPAAQEGAEVHLPVEAPIVATSPHMHLLGTGVRTDAVSKDGQEQCLSDVDWDFDWQRRYEMESGREVYYDVMAGDTVRLTCTYDNSAANQPVVDGVRGEPQDVGWGDSSLEEMCIDFLTLRVPFDPEASGGLCGGFDECYAQCRRDDPYCPLICMGNAGEACFECGTSALFGACTSTRCFRQLRPLKRCLARCDDLKLDFFGCQMEECAEEFSEYQRCAQRAFRSGTCAVDYRGCSGIDPDPRFTLP
ncbi:MAG: hypothetical protein KC621_01935 [Myxococcales bacterium]|nr:hypothetical protein [Myxococcales bacterium]